MRTVQTVTSKWVQVAIFGQTVSVVDGLGVWLATSSLGADPFYLKKGDTYLNVGGTVYVKVPSASHKATVHVTDEAVLDGIPLTRVVDVASPTVTYVCEAPPATLLTEWKWRIQRITVSGGVTTVEWHAGGQFAGQASTRTSLGYA